MLKNLDIVLKRFLPFLTVASLISGVLVGQGLENIIFLIPWIFAFITFSGSLGMNAKQLVEVLHHPKALLIAIGILHIIMPLWVWLISQVFFADDPLTRTGFLLAAVIPTGITSFIWIAINKGNLSLGLSIILVDTLLAPLVVTGSLLFLIGKVVQIDTADLILDLFLMIVIPSLLAMLLNQFTKGKLNSRLSPKLSPFSKLGILSIVFINGGIISSYLTDIGSKFFVILITVFIIACSGFVISWIIGMVLKMPRDTQITLMYAGGMRNISAGSVIAVAYFPPQVILPVVLGMLFQQVLAAFFGKIFLYFNKISREQISEV